jgi:hypothetical protein
MALQLADDPVAILDEVLSALDVWAEQAIPLVAGKAGAKAIRTRVWSLKQDIRRIAGVMIHNRSDDSMGDKDKDKPAGDAIQNAGPADPATAMAVIGEILGMPDADPTAIVAKIRELSGKGGEGAPAEGDDTMLQDAAKSKDGKGAVTQNASGAESAEVVALRGQVTELLTWKATQETTAIVQQAEGLVDKAIAAGKFAPAQRETLVALAKHDRDAFVKLAESQPRTIPLGEVGGVGRPDAATLEGSEAEVAAMVQHGYGHDEAVEAIRMLKHVEKGVPYSPKTPAPTAPDKGK